MTSIFVDEGPTPLTDEHPSITELRAALSDEAVEAAITDPRTPEQVAAQAVLDNPRSTRRQREAAWLLLRPVKIRGIEKEPPQLVKDFQANLAKLSGFRTAGLSRSQIKFLWIGYRAGRVDEARAQMAVKDGPREAFSETTGPVSEGVN